MQICFLFGSGISVPAGYPSVGDITKIVLSGKEPNAACESQKPSEVTLAFARWLKAIADARYIWEIGRTVSYEDIFFLASQIHDDCLDEFENPALVPLIKETIFTFWTQSANQSACGKMHLARLTSNVLKHIRDTAEKKLFDSEQKRKTDHLDFIAETIKQPDATKVCLLTVNHDILLERFLYSKNITFTDGFVKEFNDMQIRKWEPCLLSAPTSGIPLLKLHGGVNWVRFRPKGAAAWIEDYVGIRNPECEADKLKDKLGRRHDPLDGPMFLIGTFNKMSSYTDPVYLELYYRAYHELERTDALVTVGYGFGDKGINKLIADWLCSHVKRCIVIVDRDSKCEVRARSRGAISGTWEQEHIGKRFRFIQRNLKEDKITGQEILREIDECENAI